MKRWNCWLRPSGLARLLEGSCSLVAGGAGVAQGPQCSPGGQPRAGLRRGQPGRCRPCVVPVPPSCQAASVRRLFLVAVLWLFFIGLFPTLRDYGSELRNRRDK